LSKSLLTVLTTAFALLTGVSYAAEKIAFTCSDEPVTSCPLPELARFGSETKA